MPSFDRGTIVSVPFPYTSGETTQRRPALVVSDGAIADGLLLWVVMITSAQNRGWPGDIELPVGGGTGLESPSVVRTLKIATIEAAAATPIGKIPAKLLAAVDQLLRTHLALA